MNLPPIKVNIISLWKAWRAIRKFLHDQKVNSVKTKDMCFKKIYEWLTQPDPEPIPDPVILDKTILHFAINDYPGTANDLNGCLNDGRDMVDKLNLLYPNQFDVKRFTNSYATRSSYRNEVDNAIAKLPSGAVVLVFADSCFSGTITRFFSNNPHPTQNRFYHNPQVSRKRKKLNKKFAIGKETPTKWLTFSMCQEQQTSADAYINGEYHGAGTYYAMKALRVGMTYREWGLEIQKYLPSSSFDQAPYIEGPDYLLDKIVFEDPTLIIANSSHGTQVYDKHGDEKDSYDEALYLYDGAITDDDINGLLQNIPV